MEWRLKAKYWNGLPDKERKNYDPKQPILPGCRKPEERRRLNELAKTVSTEELNAAAQVALAFAKGESRTPPTVLELDLRHGDYMVMHGAPMQIYYEVSTFFEMTVPTGHALTYHSTRSRLRTSYVSALHADMLSPRRLVKTCAHGETSRLILQTPTMAISSFTTVTWRSKK